MSNNREIKIGRVDVSLIVSYYCQMLALLLQLGIATEPGLLFFLAVLRSF